ncbi:MAG: hypothetical protein AAGA60_07065 [Cyanobacteria bacterium P01_E01_bin.42]
MVRFIMRSRPTHQKLGYDCIPLPVKLFVGFADVLTDDRRVGDPLRLFLMGDRASGRELLKIWRCLAWL